MGYIDNNLANDEVVISRTKHSWAGLIGAFILMSFCVAIAVIIIKLPLVLSYFGVDETIVDQFKNHSDISDIISYYMLEGIGVLIGIISVFYFVIVFIVIKTSQLVVTNKRVLGRRGFISKQTLDIMLSKLDTVNVSNGLLGAIFGYGTIEVVTAASGALSKYERAAMKFAYISNTIEFKKAVLAAMDKAKERDMEEQAKALSRAIKGE